MRKVYRWAVLLAGVTGPLALAPAAAQAHIVANHSEPARQARRARQVGAAAALAGLALTMGGGSALAGANETHTGGTNRAGVHSCQKVRPSLAATCEEFSSGANETHTNASAVTTFLANPAKTAHKASRVAAGNAWAALRITAITVTWTEGNGQPTDGGVGRVAGGPVIRQKKQVTR
jgi:hypothetical protein